MTDEGYQLVVAFTDESASFVHGFQAGQIWQKMSEDENLLIEETVSSENEEVIRRMCIAKGWVCDFSQTEPPMAEWTIAYLKRRKTS